MFFWFILFHGILGCQTSLASSGWNSCWTRTSAANHLPNYVFVYCKNFPVVSWEQDLTVLCGVFGVWSLLWHITKMLIWIEMWGVWKLGQGLLLFFCVLQAVLEQFLQYRGAHCPDTGGCCHQWGDIATVHGLYILKHCYICLNSEQRLMVLTAPVSVCNIVADWFSINMNSSQIMNPFGPGL